MSFSTDLSYENYRINISNAKYRIRRTSKGLDLYNLNRKHN